MRQHISWWQFSMLVVAAHLSALVAYAPVVTGITPPTRDAWLSALIAAPPAVALVFAAYALALRFPRRVVFEYTQNLFGSLIGRAINLYLAALFALWAVIVVNEF